MLNVMRMEDLDAAIELANRSPYGNGASIFTRSGKAAREFKHRQKSVTIQREPAVAASGERGRPRVLTKAPRLRELLVSGGLPQRRAERLFWRDAKTSTRGRVRSPEMRGALSVTHPVI